MAKNKNKITEKQQKMPGFLQMVLAGLLVFLLGGGIVIGYFTLVGVPGQDNDQQKEEKKSDEPTETLDLGTIIVNLADPGGTRYLKVSVVLEYPENQKLAGELENKKHEITELVITTLRSKTVAQIQPMDKVTSLKNEIISSVNNRLTNGKISQLFFTEFIIQ